MYLYIQYIGLCHTFLGCHAFCSQNSRIPSFTLNKPRHICRASSLPPISLPPSLSGIAWCCVRSLRLIPLGFIVTLVSLTRQIVWPVINSVEIPDSIDTYGLHNWPYLVYSIYIYIVYIRTYMYSVCVATCMYVHRLSGNLRYLPINGGSDSYIYIVRSSCASSGGFVGRI